MNVDATATGLDWVDGKLSPDNQQIRGIYTLKIPTTIKNGRTLRFRFLPILQADPSNPSTNDPLHPQRNERYFWDFQEAYMQLQWLPWTIQVGNNVQSWGDTDVFNPLDVVNPRRYYDPLMSDKIGSPTVLVKREWEKVIVEALYIPYQPETVLPGESSRWLPRDIYKSRAFTGQALANGSTLSGTVNLPSTIRYHYAKDPLGLSSAKGDLTAANRDNFGARIKFRLPGFDWTLAGFDGEANAPAVNISYFTLTTTIPSNANSVDINIGPDIYLQTLYYRTRMLGTSFVLVAGDYLIKAASAQNHVVSTLAGSTSGGQDISSRLPKDDWDNVLGIERTFQVGKGQLTTLLQGTYIKRTESLDTNSVSLAHMFDRAGMLGLRWAPSEKWAVTLSGLRDFKYKGDFEHGEVSYKLSDGWTAKIAGDQLSGPLGTPTGTFSKNDRVYLSLNVQK